MSVKKSVKEINDLTVNETVNYFYTISTDELKIYIDLYKAEQVKYLMLENRIMYYRTLNDELRLKIELNRRGSEYIKTTVVPEYESR